VEDRRVAVVTGASSGTGGAAARQLAAAGYLGSFNRQVLAWRVFGKENVEDAADHVAVTLQGWGYHPSKGAARQFRTVLIQAMLVNRSPLLEDMTSEALERRSSSEIEFLRVTG
jgi:NAD(P)-dependent dehydrogenase (short-subunit alcohol dehydrogenase family)